MVGAPMVQLLVTSRPLGGQLGVSGAAASSPLLPGLEEWSVGAISCDDAVRLVRTLAPHLSRLQADRVAEACQCVPLVLRLTADALTSGRLGLEVSAHSKLDDAFPDLSSQTFHHSSLKAAFPDCSCFAVNTYHTPSLYARNCAIQLQPLTMKSPCQASQAF